MSTIAATNLKHASSGSNNIVLDSSGNTRVTAITDSAGANSSTPAAIANGTAKAWVNFNGSGTVAIRASYNVSSITDNGVGDYTVNFTTAMADANYAAASVGGNIANAGGIFSIATNSAAAPTASAYRINVQSSGGTMNDNAYVFVSFFR